MAAMHGSFDIWNIPLKEVYSKLYFAFQNDIPSFIAMIVGSIIGPVTIVANAIVIVAIWKDPFKKLRSTPSNIIIASMACCDFLVGIVCTIFSVFCLISFQEVLSNNLFGQIFLLLKTSFLGLSVLHVFSLTVDRVIAVIRPLLYKSYVTKRRVCASMMIMWGFYLILCLSQIPLVNHFYIYSVMFFLLLNTMITATAIMSTIILCRIRRPSKSLQDRTDTASPDSLRIVNARNKKATKSILLIVAIFKGCFTPFSICWMILMTCIDCKHHLNVILRVYCFSIFVMAFNSCINPFLYAFRLPKFKKPVCFIAKRLFCCFCKSSSAASQPKHPSKVNTKRIVTTEGRDKSEMDTPL